MFASAVHIRDCPQNVYGIKATDFSDIQPYFSGCDTSWNAKLFLNIPPFTEQHSAIFCKFMDPYVYLPEFTDEELAYIKDLYERYANVRLLNYWETILGQDILQYQQIHTRYHIADSMQREHFICDPSVFTENADPDPDTDRFLRYVCSLSITKTSLIINMLRDTYYDRDYTVHKKMYMSYLLLFALPHRADFATCTWDTLYADMESVRTVVKDCYSYLEFERVAAHILVREYLSERRCKYFNNKYDPSIEAGRIDQYILVYPKLVQAESGTPAQSVQRVCTFRTNLKDSSSLLEFHSSTVPESFPESVYGWKVTSDLYVPLIYVEDAYGIVYGIVPVSQKVRMLLHKLYSIPVYDTLLPAGKKHEVFLNTERIDFPQKLLQHFPYFSTYIGFVDFTDFLEKRTILSDTTHSAKINLFHAFC